MRERLYRSRDDRMLFGVAGGMADWLDLDPAIVRLVWALLVVFGGAGLLLYIIAAIVIPEEPYEPMAGAAAAAGAGSVGAGTTGDPAGADVAGASGTAAAAAPATSGWAYPQSRAERKAARRAARAARGPSSAGVVFGLILVVIGAWLLFRELFPAFDDRFVGPLVLVALGAVLVLAAVRRTGPPAG